MDMDNKVLPRMKWEDRFPTAMPHTLSHPPHSTTLPTSLDVFKGTGHPNIKNTNVIQKALVIVAELLKKAGVEMFAVCQI